MYAKNTYMYPAYVSKNDSVGEKQIIYFNDFKWRRIALSYSKKLPEVLREITSKHDSDFHCRNCLHSFATENKRESHKNM